MTCPQCGNTEFSGTDLSKPFTCPVAGCGFLIDPARPSFIRFRSGAPAGNFLSQLKQKEDGDHE